MTYASGGRRSIQLSYGRSGLSLSAGADPATLHCIVCIVTTAGKGNVTEAAVMSAFLARGFEVLVPFGSGQPYDLVVDLGCEAFLRVQCKSARPSGGCIVFNGRSTDHGRGQLSYQGRADIFGTYFSPKRTVYLVPVASGFAPRLRFEPARNNQQRGIQLAADYEVDHWSKEDLRALACTGGEGAKCGPGLA